MCRQLTRDLKSGTTLKKTKQFSLSSFFGIFSMKIWAKGHFKNNGVHRGMLESKIDAEYRVYIMTDRKQLIVS